MNKGEFAILNNTTNEAVIIDSYDRYKSVRQVGADVVIKHGYGTDKIYVDCHLVHIG